MNINLTTSSLSSKIASEKRTINISLFYKQMCNIFACKLMKKDKEMVDIPVVIFNTKSLGIHLDDMFTAVLQIHNCI